MEIENASGIVERIARVAGILVMERIRFTIGSKVGIGKDQSPFLVDIGRGWTPPFVDLEIRWIPLV